MAGVPVTWRVESGDGHFSPGVVTYSDMLGRTEVRFTPSTHRASVNAVLAPHGAPARFRTIPSLLAAYSQAPPCGAPCPAYLFFVDSTFTYRFPQAETHGRYAVGDSTIALRFDASPRWEATGTVREDVLAVVYGSTMRDADFTDGTFRLDELGPDSRWAHRIAIASGNGQTGTGGVGLRVPFVVEVRNAQGSIVRDPVIHWRVSPGSGRLTIDQVRGYDAVGGAVAWFRPSTLGTVKVTARLAGSPAPAVTFEATVPCWAATARIMFWRDPFKIDDGFYHDHDYGMATVRLGTTVEWINISTLPDPTAHFRSTAVPAGGRTFDSGPIGVNGKVQFVPEVEGSWQFEDAVSGMRGTLTVSDTLPASPRCAT